jgi:hypothetical protein
MRVSDVAMAGNICQALPGAAGLCRAWRRASSMRRQVGAGEAAGEEGRGAASGGCERHSSSWLGVVE